MLKAVAALLTSPMQRMQLPSSTATAGTIPHEKATCSLSKQGTDSRYRQTIAVCDDGCTGYSSGVVPVRGRGMYAVLMTFCSCHSKEIEIGLTVRHALQRLPKSLSRLFQRGKRE